ncbi:MAG: hypothetical protein GX786_06115 [Clostridiales bacterium]|nr:hypothetical protein [Clostridiales bacterium]
MFENFLHRHLLHTIVQSGLPYPKGEERLLWEQKREEFSQDFSLLHGQLSLPYPALLATDFLAYSRTGERKIFEKPYFARRDLLIRMTIGECVYWDDGFMDQVANGLWLLGEETSWVVSAHNIDDYTKTLKTKDRPLPDKEEPVIDLFAAQTGATISLCCHLLKGKLDQITPQIHQRMEKEVKERILTPFFTREDFWWMGFVRKELNNWTPWILSNILICLLYWEKDPLLLAKGLYKAMEILDRYLLSMPDDGGCDEGVAYWNMSGASLLDCLELMDFATQGEGRFYDDPKVQAIGCFPLYAHIHGEYFWNFADCDAKPVIDGERIWRYGQISDNLDLCRLGRQMVSRSKSLWPEDTPQMSRVLNRLFTQIPSSLEEEEKNGETEGSIFLPSVEIWAKRKEPYYFAIKGGHNAQNHNHNDVGSFLLYIQGEPQIIDGGNMVYTAQTFSEKRYDQWNTRSKNHNLPLIGGWEQQEGKEHCAQEVTVTDTGMTMELKKAYPKEAGVLSYRRKAQLIHHVTLEDHIVLTEEKPVEWVFLFREEPQFLQGKICTSVLEMNHDPCLLVEKEPYEVQDERMAKSFEGTIWRLTLRSEAKKEHMQTFMMEVKK